MPTRVVVSPCNWQRINLRIIFWLRCKWRLEFQGPSPQTAWRRHNKSDEGCISEIGYPASRDARGRYHGAASWLISFSAALHDALCDWRGYLPEEQGSEGEAMWKNRSCNVKFYHTEASSGSTSFRSYQLLPVRIFLSLRYSGELFVVFDKNYQLN